MPEIESAMVTAGAWLGAGYVVGLAFVLLVLLSRVGR